MGDLLRETNNLLDEAQAEAQMVAEMKGTLAEEVYFKQDDLTKALIDKLAAQVRTYTKETLPEPWHTYNINWLTMEIVKDLAITGIRLGTFTFPEGLCAVCGGEA